MDCVKFERDRLATVVRIPHELGWLSGLAAQDSQRKVILGIFNLVMKSLVQLERLVDLEDVRVVCGHQHVLVVRPVAKIFVKLGSLLTKLRQPRTLF